MKLSEKTLKIAFGVLVALLLITTNRSCVSASRVDKLREENAIMQRRVDSTLSKIDGTLVNLEEKMITVPGMKRIIKETPAWQTLRLEEISDKERISINALETREEL